MVSANRLASRSRDNHNAGVPYVNAILATTPLRIAIYIYLFLHAGDVSQQVSVAVSDKRRSAAVADDEFYRF